MLRTFLVFAIASASVVLVSCGGGDNSATSTPKPIATISQAPTALPTPTVAGDRRVEVLDYGYSASNGAISAAFLARNDDATEAVAVDVQIAFRDSSEASVGTAFGTITILPGDTLGKAFLGSYSPTRAQVASMDIQPALQTARWAAFPATGRLTATVTSTAGGDVRGKVVNPFPASTGDLWINVVAFDAAGKIIDGTSVPQPPIGAGASANFDAPLSVTSSPVVARVEAYPEFQHLPALEATP